MGFTFFCDGDCLFGCGYSGWHHIRNLVVKKTLIHLENSFKAKEVQEREAAVIQAMKAARKRNGDNGGEDHKSLPEQEEEEQEEDDTDEDYRRRIYHANKTTILEMISAMKSVRPKLQLQSAAMRLTAPFMPENFLDDDFHAFKEVALPKREYVDALNYFGCGGLVPLCDTHDSTGYFTPGNSWDIWYLLTTIRPTLETGVTDEENVEWWCGEVIDMFNIGWERKKNIGIGC